MSDLATPTQTAIDFPADEFGRIAARMILDRSDSGQAAPTQVLVRPQLIVRDTSNRTLRVNVLDDFVVKTRTGAYSTAERLKVGDSLVIKAYRDADGNYVAQTIRIR